MPRLKLLKSTKEFDAFFLQKKRINFFDAIWIRRYCKKIIYDIDDAVMYSDKEPERDSWGRKKWFRRTVKLAELIIAGNDYLAEHARKFNSNIEVLPTGLDIGAYKMQTDVKKDGKIRLVWIGSQGTLKYLAGIKSVLEEIGSRFDNVVLRIICSHFFELQNMVVEKRLWSLENQEEDLGTSDIGLAPLPDDRFTRGKCGFKVLQYAASGLPVVASPVGVNAKYVKDRITGFHAVNNPQWIDKITQLIKDQQLRKKMGEENMAQVKNFDVSVIGEQLVKLIKKNI